MADPPSSSKKVLSKKKVSNMLKSMKMSTPNMPPKETPNRPPTDPAMDPQTDPQARYRSRFFVQAAHETTYAFFIISVHFRTYVPRLSTEPTKNWAHIKKIEYLPILRIKVSKKFH